MTDIYKGSIDNSPFFELVDSTTGLPETGVPYTSVTAYYTRERSTPVQISLSDAVAATGAFAAGKWFEYSAANAPGVYRLDVTDGAFASGKKEVVVTVQASGCRTASRQFNLVDVNNQVAYAPNAAAGSISGVIISVGTANVGYADLKRIHGTAVPANDVNGILDVNTKYIHTSQTAASNLEWSAVSITTGTVTTGASTTSIPTSICSPSGAVADQFKGRIMIFRSDTATAALKGQASDITASSNSATPTFTVTALTTAPASGDVFVIV